MVKSTFPLVIVSSNHDVCQKVKSTCDMFGSNFDDRGTFVSDIEHDDNDYNHLNISLKHNEVLNEKRL